MAVGSKSSSRYVFDGTEVKCVMRKEIEYGRFASMGIFTRECVAGPFHLLTFTASWVGAEGSSEVVEEQSQSQMSLLSRTIPGLIRRWR